VHLLVVEALVEGLPDLIEQVAQLLAVARGTIDRLEPDQVPLFQAALPVRLDREAARIVAEIERTGALPPEDADALERTLASLADEVAAAAKPLSGQGS